MKRAILAVVCVTFTLCAMEETKKDITEYKTTKEMRAILFDRISKSYNKAQQLKNREEDALVNGRVAYDVDIMSVYDSCNRYWRSHEGPEPKQNPQEYITAFTGRQIKEQYVEDLIRLKNFGARFINLSLKVKFIKENTVEQMCTELIGTINEQRVKELKAYQSNDGVWPMPKNVIQADFCRDGVVEKEGKQTLQTAQEYIQQFDDDKIANLYTVYKNKY